MSYNSCVSLTQKATITAKQIICGGELTAHTPVTYCIYTY